MGRSHRSTANTGQTCVCANRLLVQASVYDEFAARLGRAVDTLKVGPGLDEGVTQGPLIDDAAVEKVESHIRDAVAKGATIAKGGHRVTPAGRFFEPTVLTNVTPAMDIAREETFGPVAPLFRFDTEADAIALANATEFGLAAYFYGRDIGRVWRVAEALEYGIVGVNTGLISTEVAPFGGMKESGIGREGSKYGLEEFLEVKYLVFGWNFLTASKCNREVSKTRSKSEVLVISRHRGCILLYFIALPVTSRRGARSADCNCLRGRRTGTSALR